MERLSSQNLPSNVWQGMWARLFIQAFEEMTYTNYVGVWDTLLLIQDSLPPECQIDAKKAYEDAKAVMHKKIIGSDFVYTNMAKHNQVQREAPKVLHEVISTVINSLYTHHWINKDFSAQPLRRDSPHITSEA